MTEEMKTIIALKMKFQFWHKKYFIKLIKWDHINRRLY